MAIPADAHCCDGRARGGPLLRRPGPRWAITSTAESSDGHYCDGRRQLTEVFLETVAIFSVRHDGRKTTNI